MTCPTPVALKRYRDALRQWLEHRGLEGRGGSWNRNDRKHGFAVEPKPEHFGVEGEMAMKIAGQIKESEVKEYRRTNPQKEEVK